MAVSLEDLAECLGEVLGAKPEVTEDEDGVEFIYFHEKSCAHVGIYPDDVSASFGDIETAEIIITFCTEDAEPYNIKKLSNELLAKLISSLKRLSNWGEVEAVISSEEVTVVTYYRNIRLSADELEPVEGDYTRALVLIELGLMLEESVTMSNVFSIIFSESETIEKDVELALVQCSGSA